MKYTELQLEAKFNEYLRARAEMLKIESEYEVMEEHNAQLRNKND